MKRFAIVTPFAGEDVSVVNRCVESVALQRSDSIDVVHIVVGDGVAPPDPGGCRGNLEVITLPKSTFDAGATPRAIGSAYALGTRELDGLAFLDVDNTFEPDHLAVTSHLASTNAAQVVMATRWLCHSESGEKMEIDLDDSVGDEYVDSNCLVLLGRGMECGRMWGCRGSREWSRNTGGDRIFWQLLKEKFADLNCTHCHKATVNYHTPWLSHYCQEIPPPRRCKIMRMLGDGTRRSAWVRPTVKTDKGWEFTELK